jgi:hypothetical protein
MGTTLFSFIDEILYVPLTTTHDSGLFCDLGKPLDCVNNERLLPKFNFYGIQGKVEQWFEPYLEGKVVPVHIMKEYRGGRSMAPLILNLSSRWR